MKHKDQCKVKQTSSPPEQTEEQKEAKLRFLKRMKVSINRNIFSAVGLFWDRRNSTGQS